MHAHAFDGKTVVVGSAGWPFVSRWVPPDRGRNIHVGAACARAFAQYGAQVVVLDPDAQTLADLAQENLSGRARPARMLKSEKPPPTRNRCLRNCRGGIRLRSPPLKKTDGPASA